MSMNRKQKITLGQMRASGVHSLIVYCADLRCLHWTRINADRWPDHVPLSDLKDQFVCSACGNRRADVRPDFREAG
jgi:hypothetical protein